MSRFRWPVHFGLLNNDCVWVFDEIQLMGDGLATSTQLAAFCERYKTFGTRHSIWMSATLDREWLKTVDFAPCVDALTALEFSEADRAAPSLAQRLHAVKSIAPAPVGCRTPEGLAEFIKASHTPGMQTLVVVNRVARARETFIALEKHYGLTPARGGRNVSAPAPEASIPALHLLHSRFRPYERQAWAQLLSAQPGERGRIIVATQVIEAGVDLSSQLLITDLAPYASLVQRFGRCNRTGEFMEAHIFWVDLPLNGKDAKLAAQDALDRKEQERIALPYAWHHLETARTLLADMQSASPADLPNHHDLGKAHRIFQSTLQWLPPGADPHMPWLAKSTRGGTHSRPHFRHELASALALLYMGASDLTVYLAACHHGKVRLSIRALPGETKPDAPEKKYARGIWDGDALPVTDLGDGVMIPELPLDLESMLLGADAHGTRSWLEKMIGFRDSIGVFRLAYLESLMRAADVYASAYPQEVLQCVAR